MEFILSLIQIVLIDLSLAGDNSLVVGMAVAALPKGVRGRATVLGIGAAAILRIVMAFFAIELLEITGLMLAGGLLLAWVTWKLFRDVHSSAHKKPDLHVPAAKRFSDAVWQIIVADVSMSLDNVLSVAGAARGHIPSMIFGLALSVILMAVASTQIARLMEKYPKVGYIGVAVIAYTSLHMIYEGAKQLNWIA